MIKLNFFKWLNEGFDSIPDFLLNPEHRYKTWDQLIEEFEESGGKILGHGSYGTVFSHPKWPYVLKMYNDMYYTRFVRFAYNNPHVSFPKIYNLPQKVVPFWKRFQSSATVYLVRMEKLEELPIEIGRLLVKSIDYGISYIRDKKTNSHEREYEEKEYLTISQRKAGRIPGVIKVKHHQYIIDILKDHPNFLPVYEGAFIIESKNFQAASDLLNPNNYMRRENGEIVITDPLWEGSNPYSDHKRMMDMETGAYDTYDDYEPDLIGGELPKKKRKKKIKPFKQNNFKSNDNDDVPF
jgi:hypothetical protein